MIGLPVLEGTGRRGDSMGVLPACQCATSTGIRCTMRWHGTQYDFDLGALGDTEVNKLRFVLHRDTT